jgi:hypothetical protein
MLRRAFRIINANVVISHNAVKGNATCLSGLQARLKGGWAGQKTWPPHSGLQQAGHLNHDPGDNRPRNLAALCQRCHMRHDAGEHRRRRWLNAFRVRAIGDLFA